MQGVSSQSIHEKMPMLSTDWPCMLLLKMYKTPDTFRGIYFIRSVIENGIIEIEIFHFSQHSVYRNVIQFGPLCHFYRCKMQMTSKFWTKPNSFCTRWSHFWAKKIHFSTLMSIKCWANLFVTHSPIQKLLILMPIWIVCFDHFSLYQINNHTIAQHQYLISFAEKFNFENLYISFLDQFQGCSYGDKTFGALVMVPLAQKHNIKWRHMLWSEHVHVLRFVACTEQDVNDF